MLDIKLCMSRLDGMLERQRKLHDLTFSNLEDHNPQAAKENIKENALSYADNAMKAPHPGPNLESSSLSTSQPASLRCDTPSSKARQGTSQEQMRLCCFSEFYCA